MIAQINQIGERFKEREEQELRFAALLHDIGHVPLSHTGEIVLREVYEENASKIRKKKVNLDAKISWKDLFDVKYTGDTSVLHECLSAEIVLHNKELSQIFEKSEPKVQKENIARLIVGTHPNEKLNSLLHSELDADRLDYLLRDSAFTGVGYGEVDLDYIISRLIIPTENSSDSDHICVKRSGLHTVEHYILARYFFYLQVVFNDRVRLLDLLFKDVMKYMMQNKPQRKENDWNLIKLERLIESIRSKRGTKEENLHRIYEFTDAPSVYKNALSSQ